MSSPQAHSGDAAATDQRRWYLVHCKPREDSRALEHLMDQGFECYQPVRKVEKIWGGRRYRRAEPLFPSYLFVRKHSGIPVIPQPI